MQKLFATIAVIITGAILLNAVEDFPRFGDPHSPPNSGVSGGSVSSSVHYLQNTYLDTRVPNVVTAVLADYRGYDTLFETAVILTAGIAVFAILRVVRREDEEESTGSEEKACSGEFSTSDSDGEGRHRVVVGTACRVVVPLAQLFGFYIIAHGHPSPGGGFQGGVVLGTSFILLALAGGLGSALGRLREDMYLRLACLGVFIYAGIGLLSLFFRRNFLDCGALSGLLQTGGEEMARSHGIFGVELGVAMTVTMVMFALFANLSTRGELRGGL